MHIHVNALISDGNSKQKTMILVLEFYRLLMGEVIPLFQ